MKILEDIQSAREVLHIYRHKNKKIAFIPTMGNLHEGHLSLVRKGKELADCVVVSIFVNPLQFGENEDFSAYPRTLQRDLENLQDNGATAVFIPNEAELVNKKQEHSSFVYVPTLSKVLCGITRPHFFQGVSTIVCKLFNIIQPDTALFGEKDYQQLIVIQQMVKDLCFPIEIHGCSTVREPDGLAMSSRNQYLSPQEREQAAILYRELKSVANQIAQRQCHDYLEMEKTAIQVLTQHGFRPDYVSIRRASDLASPDEHDHHLVILGAAWLGRARLIDNVIFSK